MYTERERAYTYSAPVSTHLLISQCTQTNPEVLPSWQIICYTVICLLLYHWIITAMNHHRHTCMYVWYHWSHRAAVYKSPSCLLPAYLKVQVCFIQHFVERITYPSNSKFSEKASTAQSLQVLHATSEGQVWRYLRICVWKKSCVARYVHAKLSLVHCHWWWQLMTAVKLLAQNQSLAREVQRNVV